MHATVTVFAWMCLGAITLAEGHHTCQSPNMTGILSVMSLKGEMKAVGNYSYDPVAKKLHFKDNDTFGCFNSTMKMDVLMLFEEGVFYKFDSTNQTCEKKHLQSVRHALEVPSDAKFFSEMVLGSATIPDEGLKINVWVGAVPETNAFYSVSTTAGSCLPVSTIYISDTTTLLFSNMQIESEIKDPEVFNLPSFCDVLATENPEGEVTANSFFSLFA